MAPPPAPAPRPRRKRVRLLVLTLVPVLALGGAVAAAALLIPPPTTAGEASVSPHFSLPSSTATARPEQTPTSKPPASTKPPSPHTRVVTAKDGKSELTVPKHWRKPGKDRGVKNAVLEIGDASQRQFVIVVTANKRNFAGFPAFAKLVRDAGRSDLKKVKVNGKRTLKVNGMPAIRWHYTGNGDGIRFVFWDTAVHGQKAFYQVIGVTTPSHASKARPVIRRVLDSFRETAIDV
ncbi:superantigen-like protein SSL4 [Haloechinothrix halophila]|uniref:hypothetical protein n=1 Tax=Haloechinothrix halophila TaxID=1069073 RepID=UPI000554DD00|nr:hypothetical protein [Haloechinothrix halophila]